MTDILWKLEFSYGTYTVRYVKDKKFCFNCPAIEKKAAIYHVETLNNRDTVPYHSYLCISCAKREGFIQFTFDDDQTYTVYVMNKKKTS